MTAVAVRNRDAYSAGSMRLTLLRDGVAVDSRVADPRDIHCCWNWQPRGMQGSLYMVWCDKAVVHVTWHWLVEEEAFRGRWREQPGLTLRDGDTVPLREGWTLHAEAVRPVQPVQLTLFETM